MRFKGTAILFAVFVVLGVAVYLIEFRGREARLQAEEAEKRAIQIEQNDIVEISLVYPDSTIAAAKSGEMDWEITDPPGVEADSEEWNLLASNIPQIEREEVVAEEASDLEPFGLDDPSIKVAAKLADGQTVEILFGSENPRQTYYYAKLAGGNEVFLTASSWHQTFSKTLLDLRNKNVLEFEPDDIDAIRISEGSRQVEMEKSGDDWLLTQPIETKADGTEISTFLNSIRFAQASGFAEPSVDAGQAGLDPPAIRIALHDANAQADRVVLIGRSPEQDRYYAGDASRATILIVDREIPDKTRQPVFDWRDKHITSLDRDRVEEIEIQKGTDVLSLKKVDADWELPDGRKLQETKISAMLSALEFDMASGIIDSPSSLSAYGLDNPRLEVALRQGSNELLRISFGADSSDPEGVYLKTSESAATLIVSQDVFDRFNVSVEDLVEPE